jgi:glycosyltransferase involved in cell wall biosynthesis
MELRPAALNRPRWDRPCRFRHYPSSTLERTYSVKLSVVMPVYNEAATIEAIVERVRAVKIDKEIIVVDDGSIDETPRILKKLADSCAGELQVVFQASNQGKGAALMKGFSRAGGDVIIIQDADLEYDPADYGRLLAPILDGRADVVYGSRFLGGPHRVLFFWHYVGNKLLTLFSNMLNNLNLTDMEVGYKVFRREILDRIELKSKRFGFEPEFTAKIARLRPRIYEVPISYSGRSYEEGKKITWRDGLKALFCIVWFRFFN